MDRIQKALDKARSERQALQQQSHAPAGTPHGSRSGLPDGRQVPQDIEQEIDAADSSASAAQSTNRAEAETPSAAQNASRQAESRTRLMPSAPTQLAENRLVAQDSSSTLADTFRLLRTQVLHRMTEKGNSTLAVCSANAGEGKSLVACNLAISLALNVDRSVLLVDLDLRRPSVGGYFGVEPSYGLGDYLKERRPLADCLLRPGIERLVLLPTLRPLQLSSEILSSPRMKSLAEELRTRYPDRIVIYDMPPLLATDDFLSFAPLIESALLVVEENKTPKPDIRRCLELIPPDKLIGTVLNKSKTGAGGYYYYGYG